MKVCGILIIVSSIAYPFMTYIQVTAKNLLHHYNYVANKRMRLRDEISSIEGNNAAAVLQLLIMNT